MTTPDYDVAIIGYGPVGAALANLLGMSGLKVAILEREPSLYHMPRAVSLDGEGMRLFQTIGLAETLLPKLNTSRNIRHVNTEGKLLVLISRGGIGPDGWNHAYRFFQPELEGVLREGAARFSNVDVKLRSDVFALDEHDDHVQVRYEYLGKGELNALTASYVVGCDGARSTVRRFMAAALQDLRSHERWIVLDMILDSPPAGVPEAADGSGQIVDAIQYCDPARPTTFIPMPGKRHRWEFMMMPGDDPVKIVQPDSIYNLLKPWQIEPAKSQIERAVVYTFHSSLATKWRRGRLLLAGDSAHQMPPFLGQGMGSGLRDTINLAWKLRDVVQGRAPDTLLDSYETERMEHVRAYIQLAVELGGVIQATDPEKARKRDAELLVNPTMIKPLAPRLGPGLHGFAAAPAGTRAEQPKLANGERMDDRAGYRFAVLAAPDFAAALPPATRTTLNNLDAAVIAADGEASAYLASLNTRAVVVRPDRHILGVASTAGELDLILAKVPLLATSTAAPRPVANF
ncbi:MAG: bifunctional 3-(3-hydroxy-phenyl)propionate/3-hydroxycinnamic acid hydroxylase [Pseudolabrys sp.]|nr:bifunctional 3-(3-hydroxy-phenyl)propionate/3-hydroxycinnamic acid hydroxylase [Pseudolabrys sp.]